MLTRFKAPVDQIKASLDKMLTRFKASVDEMLVDVKQIFKAPVHQMLTRCKASRWMLGLGFRVQGLGFKVQAV